MRVSFHGSCFIIGRSRLQNQITLRLCFLLLDVCSPSLFIVHEYWRNSTSYIASCHPLYLLYTHSETGSSGSCIRLYHCVKSVSIAAHRLNVYDFIDRTHHLDLLSRLLALYSVDLLLRNGWHSISGVKALTNITNGVFR